MGCMFERPREPHGVLVGHRLAAQRERAVGGELLDRHEPQVHLEQQDGGRGAHRHTEHRGGILGREAVARDVEVGEAAAGVAERV